MFVLRKLILSDRITLLGMEVTTMVIPPGPNNTVRIKSTNAPLAKNTDYQDTS